MEELKSKIGLDYDRLSRMSIVEEGATKVFPGKKCDRKWCVLSCYEILDIF